MRATVISCLAAVFGTCALAVAQTSPLPTTISVAASRTIGELKPIWRFFGADEPNYACMKDGRRLLGELGKLGPQTAYFRTHNLLCTGDGTPALKWGSTNAYTQDTAGKPVYDWTIVDGIFDAYRQAGMRPYAQIGFMPKALSTKPEPYQHHWRPGLKYDAISTGWAYPPTDYAKWAELVFKWVTHCVERYGRAEVEQWYWEVWNEPNGSYWHASPEAFYKLHDYAVDAVRRALPTARVGGPDVAGHGGKFMEGFLEHVTGGTNYATGKRGTPTDFLSFHAKGVPTFVNGHVRLGIAPHLRTMDTGFAMIARVPELKNRPIVIGESDPDGCAACQGPQLGYRNTTMYSSYTAASFARAYAIADRHSVNLEGALTWAFEFEDQPFFAGFRVLSSNGLDLPVLNVFRMFGKMSGKRVAVTSSREVPLEQIMKDGVRAEPDVAAMACAGDGKVFVMAWHYHDDDVAGPDAQVTLKVSGLVPGAGQMRVRQYLIDENHSNSYSAWKRMGSVQQPTPAQFAQLQEAGKLTVAGPASTVDAADGMATLPFILSRQAVALFVIEPL